MSRQEIALFCLNASRPFAERIAERLNLPLTAHEEREFEDGEHKCRPLVNVRDKDVFVVHSLYGETANSVNDKLCRLLFFLGALRDAAAGRVTAIVPYLCYARKDRKTKPRDPVTSKYVARLFESMDVDRLVTVDVHNLSAFQNAFRRQTDHLEARPLFVRYFASFLTDEPIAVVSPDVGGIKRAEQFRESLQQKLGRPISSAFLEKYRSAGVVSGEAVVGHLSGKTALIVDDLISSGTTLLRAAEACRNEGATAVYAAATHGAFTAQAEQVLKHPALEKIVVTDTIPPFRLDPDLVRDKVMLLDASELLAEAIRRIHTGGSLVELLEC